MGARTTTTAGVVLLLVLAACTRTTGGIGTPGAPPPSPSSAGPSPSGPVVPSSPTVGIPVPSPTTPAHPDRASALAALTPGQRRVEVRVPDGYEAISWDQSGHVLFWAYTQAWRQVGSSGYPSGASAVGAPHADAHGTMLRGMTHATFIVDGGFSGDGSGNAVAYTTGSKGWGAIKAEPNGNIGPSGESVSFGGIGLADEFAFADGQLETADCSSEVPIASCAGDQRVLKFWRWTGSDFTLVARTGRQR